MANLVSNRQYLKVEQDFNLKMFFTFRLLLDCTTPFEVYVYTDTGPDATITYSRGK